MEFDMLLGFIISFAATAVLGIFLIPFLRRLKFGQRILEIGPKWHMNKQGTPTMGGLMFIIGTTAAIIVIGAMKGFTDLTLIYAALFPLIMAGIGFIDDYCKIRKKQNQGLTALQKLVLQLAISAAFIALVRFTGISGPSVYIPFVNINLNISWVIYIFFSIIYISGFINAVNLTDGIDGLATGVTIPICAFFAGLAYIWRESLPAGTGIYAAALGGGLCAFLIYNFNPAKVFMGDTGSLYLGGAVCAMAFLFNLPLILIPVGFIYLCEMFSVILQVFYFKLTKGKRIFRMTPIHHHFEMGGWGEKKLFIVFGGVTTVLCVISFIALTGRYMA